jgi:hypothetical protein
MNHRGLRILRLSFAVLGVALAAWAALSAPLKGTTSAERRLLHFSHKLHVDNSVECDACHAAKTSIMGTDDLLPRHDACKTCHEVTAAAECSKCHVTSAPTLSERITKYSAKFSHERHLDKAKLACKDCHAELDAPLHGEQVGHLPKMRECMACHEQRRVKTDCQICHQPGDDLRPATHKLEWTHRHGGMANTEQDCNLCHKTDDCLRCHNGDPLFNPHPRDYASRHGQDAHLSDLSCSVCHDQRDFCNACHRQMNVLPVGHFRANWVGPDGGEHRGAAESDLESCMACHDAPGTEPVCARCHHK